MLPRRSIRGARIPSFAFQTLQLYCSEILLIQISGQTAGFRRSASPPRPSLIEQASPLHSVVFHEDEGPDDIAVRDFAFGFAESPRAASAASVFHLPKDEEELSRLWGWLGFAVLISIALAIDFSCTKSPAQQKEAQGDPPRSPRHGRPNSLPACGPTRRPVRPNSPSSP